MKYPKQTLTFLLALTMSIASPISAQSARTAMPSIGPRGSVLFARSDAAVVADTAAHARNPALRGAVIGGAILGTATAAAGYEFCKESDSGNCGSVVGLVGGFALGAVVGFVLGGFIGGAIGH